MLYFIKLIVFIIGSINGQWCYYCADCPVPFWRDPTRVTEQYSNTGYCVVSKLQFIDYIESCFILYNIEKKL